MEPLTTDQLFEQMQRDELLDSPLAEAGKATPRDYAKMHGIQPQRLYYYIRRGNLATSLCDCGRKVISIKEADDLLAAQEEKQKRKGK